MEIERIEIDSFVFQGIKIPTEHANILLIQGKKANLACGYFALATADKLGDRLAVVTGVKCFDDMLNAKVISVSKAAADSGASIGMTGREALVRMEQENG